MQASIEHVMWIIAGLAIAGLVITSLFSWIPKLIYTKDFSVYDVHAYYDGSKVHIFATIKNTGNIPIKQVRIDLTVGGGTTVVLNIKGGESNAINDVVINKPGLAIGSAVGVKFTVVFQDGTSKSRLVHAILEQW